MNKFWSWVFLIAAGALVLLFFSNDFGLIDIQKTAIVAAIGIDRSEEAEGRWSVTAQIAVPDANANKASNVSIPSAETVGAGIAEVNRKTGWYPTLVHCRLILLGEDVAEGDVFRVLGYFLRSEFVEDSCLVAVCEGRAQEMLGASSPVGELTTMAIAKVLSSEAQKTGLVCVTNLRDFAKGYYSAAKSGYLPFLARLPEAESGGPSEGGGGSADGGQTGGSASGGSGQSGSGGNADVFDASKTMLFYEGKRAAVLEAAETLAFNLAETSTDFAFGEVVAEENGEPVTFSLKMKISQKSRALALEGGVPICSFRIRANAQIADADTAAGLDEAAKKTIVPGSVLRAAEREFEEQLTAILKKCADSGCDLFGLKQALYRNFPREYDAYEKTLLSSARAAYDIRFSTLH